MHRLVTPDEATRMVEEFERQHAGHFGLTLTRASEERPQEGYAVVLHCPVCNDWKTAEEDNDAWRNAMALRTIRRAVAT